MGTLNDLLKEKGDVLKVAEKWFFIFNTRVLTEEEHIEYRNDIKEHNLETKEVHDYMYWLYIDYLEKILEENNIKYKERLIMEDNKKLELKEKLGSIVEELLSKLRKQVNDVLEKDEIISNLENVVDIELKEEVKMNEDLAEAEYCPSYDDEEGEYYMDLNDEDLQALIKQLEAEGIPYKLLTQEEVEKMKEEEFEYDEEGEKLVEPIYLVDNEEGYYMNIMEEDDEPSVNLTEEEIEYVESIAEEIEPIELGRVIPCNVNGEDRYLREGEDCNLVDIPLLGLTLITPINLQLEVEKINPNVESIDNIEVKILYKEHEEPDVICKATLGKLRNMGLLEMFAMFDVELDLTPIAFRGLTQEVQLYELVDLID